MRKPAEALLDAVEMLLKSYKLYHQLDKEGKEQLKTIAALFYLRGLETKEEEL